MENNQHQLESVAQHPRFVGETEKKQKKKFPLPVNRRPRGRAADAQRHLSAAPATTGTGRCLGRIGADGPRQWTFLTATKYWKLSWSSTWIQPTVWCLRNCGWPQQQNGRHTCPHFPWVWFDLGWGGNSIAILIRYILDAVGNVKRINWAPSWRMPMPLSLMVRAFNERVISTDVSAICICLLIRSTGAAGQSQRVVWSSSP